MKIITLILLAITLIAPHLEAQKLTLKEIYKEGKFYSKGIDQIRWSSQGDGYTTLDYNITTKGQDVVLNNPKDGSKKVIINSSDLVPAGEDKALSIRNYTWSPDRSMVMIFTNTRRVWRYHTRGDYWIYNLETKQLTQLGKGIEAATMMFAKFSPDNSKVAYVSKNNIYVESISTGELTKITKDGDSKIVNGTFDWVYEEEFGCRDGFRWSPDSENIAYWQSNTEGTGTFYMINNLDSIYSEPIPLPYPKVGTANSAVKVGVVSANGGDTKWLNLPGDPRNMYIPRMEFIPNSNDLMIQQMNRLQNSNFVWIADATTLERDTIMVERDAAWVDIYDDIKWLNGESAFTWTSYRDGFKQLFLISRDGSNVKKITNGDFDVMQILCIDDKGGYVYYSASPDVYTEKYLYRSKLSGKGEPERLTPEQFVGHNSYNISPDAKMAVHTFNNVSTPNVISLIEIKKHKEIRVMEDNSKLKARFSALEMAPKEFVKVDIGEVVLDAWMIKPSNFDPNKKYPVIFYVYGEPAGSTVQNSWSTRALWHHYLAEANNSIVMSVDNRGADVWRGREWRKSIYGKIGILNPADQAAAVTQILKTYDFIDSDRVGVWGWSGGGSMTLNCMFKYPKIYKTGISVAFVANQLLYDNIYQERYMGLPSENMERFVKGSPITYADQLEGDLLIIHGTGDDNVHYQNCDQLVDRLIKYDKQFDMFSYPMRSHSISERENTTYHLYQTMARYWKTHL